jgi:hypothetical protein
MKFDSLQSFLQFLSDVQQMQKKLKQLQQQLHDPRASAPIEIDSHHPAILESILSDPSLSSVYFDISWDELANCIVTSAESSWITTDLIDRYPGLFLFETDEVASETSEKYLKIYFQHQSVWTN